MPGKKKPNKGLLKRIKITAKGKVKKHKPGMSHLMAGMSGNRKRKLRRANLATGAMAKKFLRMAGRA